jgi:dsDNA-specific endonuclease/ATPase MutS2
LEKRELRSATHDCIEEEEEEKEKAKEKKNKISRRLSRKKRELPPSFYQLC